LNGYYDVYTFSGERNAEISVEMRPEGGPNNASHAAEFRIYDPNGDRITVSGTENANGFADSLDNSRGAGITPTVRLPESGTYTIVATTDSERTGARAPENRAYGTEEESHTDTFEYELRLHKFLGEGTSIDYNTSTDGALTAKSNYNDHLNGYYNVYSLEANQGDNIWVQASPRNKTIQNNHATEIRLYSQDGDLEEIGDSSIQKLSLSSGIYKIVVTSADSGINSVYEEEKESHTATFNYNLQTSDGPTADFSATSYSNGTVTFDATNTSLPGGSITEYKWDFDGDGRIEETSSTSKASYDYNEFESFSVELTVVTDEGRVTDTTTENINLNRTAPAEFSVNTVNTTTPITSGENITFKTTIKNTGGETGTTTVSVTDDTLGTASQMVTLNPGEAETVDLILQTTPGDAGSYTPSVTAGEDSQPTTVLIKSEPDPAAFSINSLNATTPVTAGEAITVTAMVENTGAISGTTTVSVTDSTLGTANETVTLSTGGTTTVNLTLQSATGNAGEYTATVTTENDSASISVIVEAQSDSAQVQISNISLTPRSVDPGSESTHQLTFEAQNVSADGDEDKFEIIFPDKVELDSFSHVAIDEKQSDVNKVENTLEFSVNPTGGGSTQISGELNVTVSATNTTADITIDLTDSNNGEDSAAATLTVVEAGAPPETPEERALAIAGVDDPAQLTQDDVTAAITRFNRGESVNGLTIEQDDVTAVITLFERN
jgi:acyl-CoA hydrolase